MRRHSCDNLSEWRASLSRYVAVPMVRLRQTETSREVVCCSATPVSPPDVRVSEGQLSLRQLIVSVQKYRLTEEPDEAYAVCVVVSEGQVLYEVSHILRLQHPSRQF